MARKPRIGFEGAFYHIIVRGNRRQNIFLDESDFRDYLERLHKYMDFMTECEPDSAQPSGKALELLKMYNREDTVNLFDIAEIVYERLRAQPGIEEFLSILVHVMRGQ